MKEQYPPLPGRSRDVVGKSTGTLGLVAVVDAEGGATHPVSAGGTPSDSTRTDPPPKHKNNNEAQALDTSRETVALSLATPLASEPLEKSTSTSGLDSREQLALEQCASAVQDHAMARVEALVSELRREGWDFVAVQIARVIRGETESLVPGAQFFRATKAIGPALPREADTLRSLADHLDTEFRKLGCREATEGYVQVVPLQGELQGEVAS